MPRSFEEAVLPHLDAAFNYARWLSRNDADAEDVVQEASMRAFRFFSSFRGGDARAWLLAIVRNTWYGRFPRRASASAERDPAHAGDVVHAGGVAHARDVEPDHRQGGGLDPETLLIRQQSVDRVRRALDALPPDFREVIVLRELEGMSYREIAEIAGIPMGTVMSRLSRARERLLGILIADPAGGGRP